MQTELFLVNGRVIVAKLRRIRSKDAERHNDQQCGKETDRQYAPLASIEEEAATNAGLVIGDKLQFFVAGREVEADEACAVVESVKAASDVYAPIAGTVTEANEALADTPEAVNQDAYGEGWLIKLKPSSSDALADLMDVDAYREFVESE